jgi:hypothetical protein
MVRLGAQRGRGSLLGRGRPGDTLANYTPYIYYVYLTIILKTPNRARVSPDDHLCYSESIPNHKEPDMGSHRPLPSDPIDRAAEKRRRFKAYQKDWKQRRRVEAGRVAAANYRAGRALLLAARQLNLDLCVSLEDMSEVQLRRALQTASSWRDAAKIV